MKIKILILSKRALQFFALFCLVLLPYSIKAQANVYITPSAVVLSGQSTFTVDVMIANVTNLHGYSVKIVFDNSIINFQSAVKGPLLSTGGSTYFVTSPIPIIDSVEAAEVILGAYSVNGSGKLFSITFNVLSAGISLINIADVILRDINNSNIPVTWISSQVVIPLSVNVKTFLQGPFFSTGMSTTLNSSGYLPLSQPYNLPPWNYNGSESVLSGFFKTHHNIVDWILIELRTGTSASTIVDRKVGFLNYNGTVVDLDGTSSLYYNKVKGNYYIVIYHRNHVPIMTSNYTLLDYVSAQYDFTSAQSKAYGINAMANLGIGYFGMFAGDANGNGQVQNNDHENYWIPQNGQSGYKSADFNLNGQVQNNDNESYWVPNNGKGTQVPN
jgi:hypothetical protein